MYSESGEPDRECKELFALLSQYLDEELPPETCEHIRHHISGCAPCVEFLSSLRRSIDLVHKVNTGEHPGPLPESTRQDLRAAYQKILATRCQGEAAPSRREPPKP